MLRMNLIYFKSLFPLLRLVKRYLHGRLFKSGDENVFPVSGGPIIDVVSCEEHELSPCGCAVAIKKQVGAVSCFSVSIVDEI